MPKLSDNYYLRNYYLETEQVPTQSMMKEKMSLPLASVYFKSMTPKLKVLAGLEPPMKGGGSDWFIPPDDLLKGRAVMKPIKHQFLTKLGFNGIDFIGEKILEDHQQEMEEEKRRILLANDIAWKKTIDISCCQRWDEASKEQSKKNTMKIQHAFQEFTSLYSASINKIEHLLKDASEMQIKRRQKETFNKMAAKFETLVKHQATMMYDQYTEKLLEEKTKLKEQFISAVEISRTAMGNKLRDINIEKHVAVEKLRVLLECQNLACQVYVSLKEREVCRKQIEIATHEHKKKMKELKERIMMQDFEIRLAKEKEKKRQEFIRIWQKKVCHVVKRFQDFVKYCLNTLPDHADFFINMEKLMLLQLSEVLENPSGESIFISEEETLHTPIAKPHPFFLFCDKGYKPKIDETLCPKHCTSSSSQLPVIVVNRRCIYSACDNFQTFTSTLTQLLENRGVEKELSDDHDYTYDIPVKVTSSDQLLQLKLESSLMQILQEEIPNPRNVKIDCCVCKVSTCYCESPAAIPSVPRIEEASATPEITVNLGKIIESRNIELDHYREPKLESYIEYVMPIYCACAKRVKKHLKEHLPAYMRNMSSYDVLNLPHYEPCSLDQLKDLVKRARGWSAPSPKPVKADSKTKNADTQYSDHEFEFLCTCFSDEEIEKLFKNIAKGTKLFDKKAQSKFGVVNASLTSTNLNKDSKIFARDRAFSLRRLLDQAPELEEIFRSEDCRK